MTSLSLSYRDAVDWLSEHDSPAVRYWALRDLQGASENNPEALDAQRKIPQWPPVGEVLRDQNTGGYWAYPEDCYWPKWRATVWPLILLAEMGIRGDHPAIRGGCEYFLQTAMAQDKSWPPLSYPDPGGYRLLWEPCVTGNMARTLTRVGYGDDPRVREMFDWLVQHQLPDGGWNCETGEWGKDVCHSSFMSTIEPLWAFSELDRNLWPKGGKEAVERGSEFMLMHRLYKSDKTGRVINEEWTKLHFPLFYFYDILHGLRVLTKLGYGGDDRLSDALQLLKSKRLPDGVWPMDGTFVNAPRWNFVKDASTGTWQEARRENATEIPEIYHKLGRVGEPSPWITLNALRVLKQLE